MILSEEDEEFLNDISSLTEVQKNSVIAYIKNKTNFVDELLLNVLYQACQFEKNKVDNQDIGVYEQACSYLFLKGVLKKKNSRIFYITKKKH